MCWKASNTEVWMYVTTSFITNTSEDKPLKCTEHTDHLHRNNQDKNEQRQWQYTGHKFQAMCREIFPVDSILAMCSLPISDYHWVWHVTTEMKQTGEKKNPKTNENTTWHIRQTVIQVLCAAFLPECLQLLGKLNDCTAVSGAQGSLTTKGLHFFFF